MATKEDMLNCVRSHIWSGEVEEAEVAYCVEDTLGKVDESDEDWLRQTIQSEFESKRKAEETWPAVTDFDRLDRAFSLLEAQGVVALHRAGFTQSDGFEEVQEFYDEAGGEKSDYEGYCFYTEQDQEGAMKEAGICIAFGHFSGKDAKGVKIGKMLRVALEHEGFSVEWDGTIKTRLRVKDFRWQRRSPT